MYNEYEKKEERKENCVTINVFTKCEEKKDCKKGCNDKKEDKNENCVVINVFTDCRQRKEDKKDNKEETL